MKPVITIFANGDGTTRVSRVTAHGEEVIQPNVEVAAMCAKLYALLAQGWDPQATSPLAGISESLVEASRALTEARDAVMAPYAQMTALLGVVHDLHARMDKLDRLLQDRTLTVETTEKWMAMINDREASLRLREHEINEKARIMEGPIWPRPL